MVYIFWGLLITFIDFFGLKINAGSFSVGLVPGFIGFLLLWRGLIVLSPESSVFKKLVPTATAFLLVSVFMYVVFFFNLIPEDNMIKFVVQIVYATVRLFFTYFIIRGIKDMEAKRNAEFFSTKLFRLWVAVFVFNIVATMPKVGGYGLIPLLWADAFFMLRVWDAMKNYNDCLEKNGPAKEE